VLAAIRACELTGRGRRRTGALHDHWSTHGPRSHRAHRCNARCMRYEPLSGSRLRGGCSAARPTPAMGSTRAASFVAGVAQRGCEHAPYGLKIRWALGALLGCERSPVACIERAEVVGTHGIETEHPTGVKPPTTTGSTPDVFSMRLRGHWPVSCWCREEAHTDGDGDGKLLCREGAH
jgi:hypothetical protein